MDDGGKGRAKSYCVNSELHNWLDGGTERT